MKILALVIFGVAILLAGYGYFVLYRQAGQAMPVGGILIWILAALVGSIGLIIALIAWL